MSGLLRACCLAETALPPEEGRTRMRVAAGLGLGLGGRIGTPARGALAAAPSHRPPESGRA